MLTNNKEIELYGLAYEQFLIQKIQKNRTTIHNLFN